MRYDINNIILVVVDIQERLYPYIYENIELEDKLNRIINGFNALDLPVIVTEQYTKGLGFTLPSIINSLGNNYIVSEKLSFSCFGDDIFKSKLTDINKKQLVLIGIETHVCITQTALDAIDSGYNVIIPEDCVGSRSYNDKKIALERMKNYGASITTYESLLMELIKGSDHPKFKDISKIIK